MQRKKPRAAVRDLERAHRDRNYAATAAFTFARFVFAGLLPRSSTNPQMMRATGMIVFSLVTIGSPYTDLTVALSLVRAVMEFRNSGIAQVCIANLLPEVCRHYFR